MWPIIFFSLVSFVGLFNLFDSYADKEYIDLDTYTHVIEVTDMDLEIPIPYPRPMDDGEMVAKKIN